jgi:3-polyprenyl-4-hydroxybenzoate decarboxylase
VNARDPLPPDYGGKFGIDASTKIGTETTREWGRVITKGPAVEERVDRIWSRLGLCRCIRVICARCCR